MYSSYMKSFNWIIIWHILYIFFEINKINKKLFEIPMHKWGRFAVCDLYSRMHSRRELQSPNPKISNLHYRIDTLPNILSRQLFSDSYKDSKKWHTLFPRILILYPILTRAICVKVPGDWITSLRIVLYLNFRCTCRMQPLLLFMEIARS